MPLSVTALYLGLLTFVYLALMGLVGRARGQSKRSLGVGDDKALIEADRRHMNFVENVPLALLLIAVLELNGAGKMFLHGLGLVLLVSRIVHPFGIAADKMATPARGAGALGTFVVQVVAALALLKQALFG